MNEEEDGKTHINVYSRAKTPLGRVLSNFAATPFTLPIDGTFMSVEGYWYWLTTKDDRLRRLSGFEAKKLGRELRGKDWCLDDWFVAKIEEAIVAKVDQNPTIKQMMAASPCLPFCHYYVYGGKTVMPTEGLWIIALLEALREESRREQGCSNH